MTDDQAVGNNSTTGDQTRSSRRRFIASGSALLGTALAGCTGGGDGGSGSGDGSSGNGGGGGTTSTKPDVEDVTIYLTPGTPADVRQRYEPLMRMINGEIDTVNAEAEVLGSYSAIRPALRSGQGEVGMDDITFLSSIDFFDVYGTSVTGGSAFYFSMFLTQEDSDIDELTDLEGRRVGFADRLSTSGSIFASAALQDAGLDIGDAPQGQPVDFEGVWSNHDVALEKLGNDDVDAATTWSGNGFPHIPEKYRSDIPDRVLEEDSFVDTLDTESPKFRPFWWSFPIPKQPVYARKDWDSPNKEKIGDLMLNSNEEKISQYYPEDYNEEELPFTTLEPTSADDYQPILDRIEAVGLDLGEL